MKTTYLRKNQTLLVNYGEIDGGLDYTIQKRSEVTLIFVLTGHVPPEISVTVRLAGTGACAKIIALVVGKCDFSTTLHTLQLHEAPETTSNLLVKTVLSDNASFVYNGTIRVNKKAQKTDAYQRNENLLLSKGVHATSKPTLEILANDVRCTHGSATGKLDPLELWYLRSRGIARSEAQKLLVAGFLTSALNDVKDTHIHEKIFKMLYLNYNPENSDY